MSYDALHETSFIEYVSQQPENEIENYCNTDKSSIAFLFLLLYSAQLFHTGVTVFRLSLLILWKKITSDILKILYDGNKVL